MNLQKLCEAVDQAGVAKLRKDSDGDQCFELMEQSEDIKTAVIVAHVLSLPSDQVNDDTYGHLDWKEVIYQSLSNDQAHIGFSIAHKAYSIYETEIRNALEYGYIKHLEEIEAGNAVDNDIKDAKEAA